MGAARTHPRRPGRAVAWAGETDRRLSLLPAVDVEGVLLDVVTREEDDRAGGVEVSVLREVGTFEDVDGSHRFRDEEVEIGIALAVGVASHVHGQTVDEKLQGTLEQRLGASFKMVNDSLAKVHESVGEMQALAAGVGDLKRILSNVKSKGTWGEVALGNILEEILAADQYAPQHSEGSRLLAHELVHVVQQGAAAGPSAERRAAAPPASEVQPKAAAAGEQDAFEQEAERIADAVAA